MRGNTKFPLPPAPGGPLEKQLCEQTLRWWIDMLNRCELESDDDYPAFKELLDFLERLRR